MDVMIVSVRDTYSNIAVIDVIEHLVNLYSVQYFYIKVQASKTFFIFPYMQLIGTDTKIDFPSLNFRCE